MEFAAFVIILSFIGSSIAQTPPSFPCTPQLQNRHFPSGFDCQSYWTCFEGSFVLQVCPEGFWFARVDEVCRSFNLVDDCEFAPPPTNPPPTNPPPATTTPPTTTAPPTNPPPPITEPDTTTSTAVTSNPLVECPPSGVSYYVNPFSCTRYFMCFDGTAIVKSCSPGLYFSRSQRICVRRERSDCLLDDSVCPLDNDPNNVVFLPDQYDCQNYFVCYDGVPQERSCDNSLHWDPNSDWCIKEEDSECVPNYPLPDVREIECPQDTENDVILLPHPEECEFYFICIDGTSILARCNRHLLFDYSISKCNFAHLARCFSGNPHPDLLE